MLSLTSSRLRLGSCFDQPTIPNTRYYGRSIQKMDSVIHLARRLPRRDYRTHFHERRFKTSSLARCKSRSDSDDTHLITRNRFRVIQSDFIPPIVSRSHLFRYQRETGSAWKICKLFAFPRATFIAEMRSGL